VRIDQTCFGRRGGLARRFRDNAARGALMLKIDHQNRV
jgi:hypothetical protein